MGDIADQIIDGFFSGRFDYQQHRRPRGYQAGSGRFCWRDANGIVRDMREMTVSHLRSAIAKCRAEKNTGKLADLEEVLSEKVGDFFTPVVDNS